MFFETIDAINSFFAASTHRWIVLIKHTNVAVRRLLTTQSTHNNAVKPLKKNFEKFVEGIEALCSTNENLNTIGTTESLLPTICHYTFLYFWLDILEEVEIRLDYTQSSLQLRDKSSGGTAGFIFMSTYPRLSKMGEAPPYCYY